MPKSIVKISAETIDIIIAEILAIVLAAKKHSLYDLYVLIASKLRYTVKIFTKVRVNIVDGLFPAVFWLKVWLQLWQSC